MTRITMPKKTSKHQHYEGHLNYRPGPLEEKIRLVKLQGVSGDDKTFVDAASWSWGDSRTIEETWYNSDKWVIASTIDAARALNLATTAFPGRAKVTEKLRTDSPLYTEILKA